VPDIAQCLHFFLLRAMQMGLRVPDCAQYLRFPIVSPSYQALVTGANNGRLTAACPGLATLLFKPGEAKSRGEYLKLQTQLFNSYIFYVAIRKNIMVYWPQCEQV